MLQITVSRNGKGKMFAETYVDGQHLTGSSDTVAGALQNLAVAVRDGKFEVPLLVQFTKEAQHQGS